MPRNPDGAVLSHWHTLFEDFSTSTQDFYAAVEEALSRRKLPDIEVSQVLFSEGGIGTAKRKYLRVCRNRIVFDICSAPYGNGHFFSWWLAKIPAKYGLLILVIFSLLLLPMWAAIVFALGRSCGVMLSAVFFSLSIPVILFLLGLGVERGLIGDEEWLLSVPVIGYLYALIFNPTTYYRLDTAYMFRDSVRAAVNEVLNDLREERGLRLLGEEDLRPDAREEEAAG